MLRWYSLNETEMSANEQSIDSTGTADHTKNPKVFIYLFKLLVLTRLGEPSRNIMNL